LESVEKLCDKAMWIRDGYLAEYGDATTVCKKYLQYMMEKDEKAALLVQGAEDKLKLPSGEQQEVPQDGNANLAGEPSGSQRWGNGDITLYQISLEDEQGQERRSFGTGDPMVIRIKYRKNRDVKSIGFGIGIHRVDGVHCYGTNTFIDQVDIEPEQMSEEGEILCRIDPMSLVEGAYTLDVAVHDKDGLAYDYITQVLEFSVHSEIKDVGVSRLFHSWKLIK